MVKLASLFAVERGSSHGGSDYRAGEVAFITSTEKRNGVAAFVNPLDGDRVFDGPLVTVSALGHATLQQGRFLPKSNGGDAVVVLRPSKPVDRRCAGLPPDHARPGVCLENGQEHCRRMHISTVSFYGRRPLPLQSGPT